MKTTDWSFSSFIPNFLVKAAYGGLGRVKQILVSYRGSDNGFGLVFAGLIVLVVDLVKQLVDALAVIY
jgi:hypothetical protein